MIISASRRTDIPAFYCAEPIDLNRYGILHGKCIDDDYIKKVFNIDISPKKDKNQRKECGCIESKDIGVYDTCLHGCKYCYANRSDSLAIKNSNKHRKDSPSLLGWYECRLKNSQRICTPSF